MRFLSGTDCSNVKSMGGVLSGRAPAGDRNRSTGLFFNLSLSRQPLRIGRWGIEAAKNWVTPSPARTIYMWLAYIFQYYYWSWQN